MKILAVILLAISALTALGYHWIETAKYHAALELKRRDDWIADTIASLKKGESSVSLYSCANTNLLLEKIQDMPEVERIVFEQTLDLSAEGLQYLPSLPNLRQLEFRGDKALNDQTIDILTRCQRLETVGIKLCGVTDDGLLIIAKIPNLKTFRYSGSFSQPALSALGEKLPDTIIREAGWYE